MAKRRSFDDALTADEEAFLKKGRATTPAAAPLKISNLSVRIDSRIAASLLRAMTERRIEGATPATQQDIVAEAMVDWLKKNGYFR